jgi:hypothetical protein
MQKDRGEGKILKLVSEAQNGVDWYFSMSRLRFKSTDLLGEHTTLHLSLAVPGLGLPQDIFMKFATMVQRLNPNIICV